MTTTVHTELTTGGRDPVAVAIDALTPFTELTPTHRAQAARAVVEALTAIGEPLLPNGGQSRVEWGVAFHASKAPSEVTYIDIRRLASRADAERCGRDRIGEFDVRGFSIMRRRHVTYPAGTWTSRWERDGEPYWFHRHLGRWRPITDLHAPALTGG